MRLIKPDNSESNPALFIDRPINYDDEAKQTQAHSYEPIIPRLSGSLLKSLESERVQAEENELQQAHRLYREHAVATAYRIIDIAINSPNERLALQAAQYVQDRALGRVQDTPREPLEDPFARLLAQCVIEVEASERIVTEDTKKTDELEGGANVGDVTFTELE